MTRISFTRGLRDEGEADPTDPAGTGLSLGLVVACCALAVLALTLSLTVFLTLRGLGRSHAPPPLQALKVTVPVQDFAVTPVSSPPPSAAPPVRTPPAAASPAAPSGPAPPSASPRRDHSEAMLAILRRAKGVITLQVENDPGAEASARDMTRLLRAAGWTVNWNSVFGSGPAMTGFSAALGDTPQDDAIRQAFGEAGIRLGPPPQDAGVIQAPEIFVGADRAEREAQ